MHSRHKMALPVQVEAVTDEEWGNAMDWDLDTELRQLSGQLQIKLLFLQKNNLIDERTFFRLRHLLGMRNYVYLLTSVVWQHYVHI